MPDGSSFQSDNLKKRLSSGATVSQSNGHAEALHYAEAFPSAEAARTRIARLFGVPLDSPKVPFVVLPKAAECDEESSIGVFLEKRSDVLSGFALTEQSVCYVYSEETPVHCLVGSLAKQKRARQIFQNGTVCFLYKNGCQESDFDDASLNQFMPERFDTPADEVGVEREEHREEFRRRISDLVGDPKFSEMTSQQIEFLFLEVLHGRVPYKAWKETDECKSIKVPRDRKNKSGKIVERRRTVADLIPTKYFESHWADFDGNLTAIRQQEISLYDDINILTRRDFPDYIQELVDHLNRKKRAAA